MEVSNYVTKPQQLIHKMETYKRVQTTSNLLNNYSWLLVSQLPKLN